MNEKWTHSEKIPGAFDESIPPKELFLEQVEKIAQENISSALLRGISVRIVNGMGAPSEITLSAFESHLYFMLFQLLELFQHKPLNERKNLNDIASIENAIRQHLNLHKESDLEDPVDSPEE